MERGATDHAETPQRSGFQPRRSFRFQPHGANRSASHLGCSSLTRPMWWWISATAEALKRSTEMTISSLLRRLQPRGRQIPERDRSTRIYRWKERVVQRWQLWLSTPHDAGCACFSRFSLRDGHRGRISPNSHDPLPRAHSSNR